jgi:hypothetical protein
MVAPMRFRHRATLTNLASVVPTKFTKTAAFYVTLVNVTGN